MFDGLKQFFLREKAPVEPAAVSERVRSAAERRPVQKYVYPPVVEGIPRYPVTEILGEHEELIDKLRKLSENKAVFDERHRVVIERYANYVYLLPASEAHHHRGTGGLLRHGLEVAKYVLQESYDRLHGMQLSPRERKAARERWLFAAFVAGLCHDIGKVADMEVFTPSGQVWDHHLQPLAAWFHELPGQEDRVYVQWRRERQDHRQMGLSKMAHHILTQEDLTYLHVIEPVLLGQIHQAIMGEGAPRNAITEMLEIGDKKSVSQDLKESNLLWDLGPQVGQPLLRHYVMAMRRLLAEKRWLVNEPGAVVWVMGQDQGVYLVWPQMTEDILDVLQQDGTPTPSNPMVMADILQDHEFLRLAPNCNRLWRIWPSRVEASAGLLALRLKDPRYIFDPVPPGMAGLVCGEGQEPPSAKAAPKEFSGHIPKGPAEPIEAGGQPLEEGIDSSQPLPTHTPLPPPSPTISPPGISEEPKAFARHDTVQDLQDHFARSGVGGRALLQLALEVKVGTRQEGVDYQMGPQMLLAWGERKFTAEDDLVGVLQNLAEADWLVLDGTRRVHEEPGFGRCLKLRLDETNRFFRLVELWCVRPSEKTESLGEEKRTESRSEAAPEVTDEPGWVLELSTLVDRHGYVDYDQAETLMRSLTGYKQKQKIQDLLNDYFELGFEAGRLVVHRRS
jgi:Putative helicase